MITTNKKDQINWGAVFCISLLAVTVLRICFLCVFPYDLSPDEAYYWDWSRHLSWGYYSKPPMVAWLIGLFNYLLGTSEFSVKLPAAICGSITLAGLFVLGRMMFGSPIGFFSALVFFATIGSAVSSMIMTIDAPLLCFWTLSMAMVWKAWQSSRFEPGGASLLWWTLAGITTALGLLSKQTMAGFSLAVILFLILNPRGWKLLFSPEPYLFISVQLFLIFPFLEWNQRHDWITFRHTAHHFESGSSQFILNFKTFLELMGTQAGIVTPLLFFLTVVVSLCFLWMLLGKVKRRGFRKDHFDRILFLLIVGLLPLSGVFLLSLKQRINANWPAPFYLSLGVLLSAWAVGRISCSSRMNKLRGLYLPGIILGIFMVAALYMLPLLSGVLGLEGSKMDPALRLKGWKQLGLEAGEIIGRFPDREKTFIVARRRQTVSELAFYMPGRPEVYRWNGINRPVTTQYELWPGPKNKKGWDALIIMEKDKYMSPELVSCFKKVEFIGEIDIPLGRDLKRSFLAYRGIEMQHWAAR